MGVFSVTTHYFVADSIAARREPVWYSLLSAPGGWIPQSNLVFARPI